MNHMPSMPEQAETAVEQALRTLPLTGDQGCPEHVKLRAVVRGTLPQEEAQSISEHIALCPTCRAVYADLERAKLISRTLDRAVEASPKPRRLFPRLSWAMAVAGVLLLFVVVRVAFQPSDAKTRIWVDTLTGKGPEVIRTDIALRVKGADTDGTVGVHPPPTLVWDTFRVPSGHRLVFTIVDLKTLKAWSVAVPNTGVWQAPPEWFEPGQRYRVNWITEPIPQKTP